MFGVVAFWVGQLQKVRRLCSHPMWLVLAGILSLGCLALSKTSSMFGTDWSIGIAFALWVIGLGSCEHHVSWLNKMSTALSEMSYTLYLVYFPLLAFVFFCYFEGRRFFPGIATYLEFGALLTATMAFAAAMWWCFERNTDRIRKHIEVTIFPRDVPEVADKCLKA
jgi:peptidoglycan/LPS O-acetylase OafA/YrhL